MGVFKKVESKDRLVLKQRGGAVVFLESEEDFQIIAKRWFHGEGEDIWFRPADAYETGTGGGGCKAVIDLVEGCREDDVGAFGLVDRDALLNDRNWSLWWEDQDDDFLAARPYGDYIRVLLRWELENYLFDPDAMADVANDAAMTSEHTADSVVASCLGCVDELKDRTAATVAAKAANLSQPEKGFGCNPLLQGPAMTEKLQDHLSKKGHENAGQVMTDERRRIDRFDSPTAPARERWEHLVRMLDGKASLKYLGFRTGTRFDERRGDLARRMFEKGAVPVEIRDYVEAFKAAGINGVRLG